MDLHGGFGFVGERERCGVMSFSAPFLFLIFFVFLLLFLFLSFFLQSRFKATLSNARLPGLRCFEGASEPSILCDVFFSQRCNAKSSHCGRSTQFGPLSTRAVLFHGFFFFIVASLHGANLGSQVNIVICEAIPVSKCDVLEGVGIFPKVQRRPFTVEGCSWEKRKTAFPPKEVDITTQRELAADFFQFSKIAAESSRTIQKNRCCERGISSSTSLEGRKIELPQRGIDMFT